MTEKVTKIVAQKRAGRYNIYLDGKYAFPISESVMIKFRVFKGMEIDAELQTAMIAADDVSRAYTRALDYLSHQLRTEKEVHDKLRDEEIEEPVIDATMQQLRELRLLNDQQYADAFVRTAKRTSDKGPRVIRQNLRQKGVGEQLIDDALAGQFSPDEQIDNASELARKLAKRYHKQAFKTMQQKVRQGMMTKGFDNDTITAAIAGLDLQPDEDEQWQALVTQGTKLWKRNRKYSFRERAMRTKRSLFQKGFMMDEINRFIDEQVADE
ncbi:recombination regulator RecX [Lactiplantibacillus pentosus]|jgi:regulatory protein|uniref:recombination regulator RecX n=1 Tax=Lactiplantibacillus pentosus TaxID=1589 RepID=UPI002079D9EC|nr:recombination regulator RecX [Lactiplantibacillus pentosus]USJ87360.1 recombination regulator RecX [Lactiplantibacillus pentosus]